jgi:hypothetical protein
MISGLLWKDLKGSRFVILRGYATALPASSRLALTTPLPTFVWGMIRSMLTPSANAIGTMIIIMSLLATTIAVWLTKFDGDVDGQ